MGLTDTKTTVTYLIRDRDTKYPAPFDEMPSELGIHVVLTGIRIPRMNAILGRWVQTSARNSYPHPYWAERHTHFALRRFELHYNLHRPHQTTDQAAPLRRPRTAHPRTDRHLDVRRRVRLGRILHEYRHAA